MRSLDRIEAHIVPNRTTPGAGPGPVMLVALMAVLLAACSGGGPSSSVRPGGASSPSSTGPAGGSASPARSPSPATPSSAAISPGGGTILYGRILAGHEDRFVVMSPSGANEHELDVGTAGCTACAVGSPDGRAIAVPVETVTGVGTARLEVTGDGYKELPLPGGLNLAPRAWSPTGDRLAFDGWSDQDPALTGAYTSASDGSDLKQIVASPDGRHYIPMGYSPDGRLLLLFREGRPDVGREHAGDLFVVDSGGGEALQVNPVGTVLFGFDIVGFNPASWSPDGRSVAFGAFDGDGADGRSAVFVADVETLEARRVSAWTRWSPYARWSPTGEWIAFGDVVDGERSISIVKPDGTGEKTLAGSDAGACCADWSPEGRLLIHQRGSEGSSDLWVMDLEGNDVQVTHAPGRYLSVWWMR